MGLVERAALTAQGDAAGILTKQHHRLINYREHCGIRENISPVKRHIRPILLS